MLLHVAERSGRSEQRHVTPMPNGTRMTTAAECMNVLRSHPRGSNVSLRGLPFGASWTRVTRSGVRRLRVWSYAETPRQAVALENPAKLDPPDTQRALSKYVRSIGSRRTCVSCNRRWLIGREKIPHDF